MGTVKLPHVPRPRMKICVLGDAVHCEQAQKQGIPFKSVDDLKKLNKNKKLVKKLAQSFDGFLASQVLIPQIRVCWAPASTRPVSSRPLSSILITLRARLQTCA